ncbi:MAG: glutaredoxin family protein [Zoogloeaceae bacterium]|nr:glutaredoxin family protein [Zoogloeaceae bacterium]
MATNDFRLTLLSRTYCHLCHDMEAQLKPVLDEFGVEVDIVDVDSSDELEARWGELVPVLLHADTELCHYFLDVPKVRDYLRQIR